MRDWMLCLINNENAYVDFIRWVDEQTNAAKNELHKAVLADEIEKARQRATEIELFKKFALKLNAEYNERKSQFNYNEKGV